MVKETENDTDDNTPPTPSPRSQLRLDNPTASHWLMLLARKYRVKLLSWSEGAFCEPDRACL